MHVEVCDSGGFELNYQHGCTFLPGSPSHFGAQLNYTYVDSEVMPYLAQSATTTRNDLLGLPKNAYNATLYWENEPLNQRLSSACNDEFLEALPAHHPQFNLGVP